MKNRLLVLKSIWTCNASGIEEWNGAINQLMASSTWICGKMLEDFHAARVLPGYEPDNKIAAAAPRIARPGGNCHCHQRQQQHWALKSPWGLREFLMTKKYRAWSTNSMNWGFLQAYRHHPICWDVAADAFANNRQERIAFIPTIRSRAILTDMDHIISPMMENDHISKLRNLVVVTAPGPGSW